MASKPSITIIGAGRLGVPLAEALVESGYLLREIVYRSPKNLKKRGHNLPGLIRHHSVSWERARFDADVIWLCVPDVQIMPVAQNLQSLTLWPKKIVFHSSGLLTSDALQVLRAQGASVASVHPLMTFVHGSKPPLKNVLFGLEGDQTAVKVARQIVKGLRGDPFLVRKRDKALYHVWGTLLSPLFLAFVATTEQVARYSGIPAQSAREKMFPIVMQTLSNYANRGLANSFSGPLVRGDSATIGAHLKALERIPEARETYIALARSALHYLPVRNRREIEKLLKTQLIIKR